jgi:hypothetical protein
VCVCGYKVMHSVVGIKCSCRGRGRCVNNQLMSQFLGHKDGMDGVCFRIMCGQAKQFIQTFA